MPSKGDMTKLVYSSLHGWVPQWQTLNRFGRRRGLDRGRIRRGAIKKLLTRLVDEERIETTHSKAEELRKHANRLIELAREQSPEAQVEMSAMLSGRDDLVEKVQTTLVERYAPRATQTNLLRVLRSEWHRRDATPMAFVEFIDREGELRAARPPEDQEQLEFNRLNPEATPEFAAGGWDAVLRRRTWDAREKRKRQLEALGAQLAERRQQGEQVAVEDPESAYPLNWDEKAYLTWAMDNAAAAPAKGDEAAAAHGP